MSRIHTANTEPPISALVLSGGGMRGAYEAGVVAGLIEVLDLGEHSPPPFHIFVGTSVGSLNATYLAAHAHRGDLGIGGLLDLWCGLRLEERLRLDLLNWLSRRRWARRAASSAPGRSLLDPGPIEQLIREAIPWDQLHENIGSGRVRALVAPALEVSSGQTWVFAELAPGQHFPTSRDPHRRGVVTQITPDHVLASAAIPAIFPPRRVGEHYFYDGGIRHNTPIAPAIRLGAEHLVVIAAMRSRPTHVQVREEQPDLGFLAGKLLNAVILDPVAHDIMVLQRLNQLLAALVAVVSPADMEQIQQVLIESRGAPYRHLDLLSFRPGVDLGKLTLDYLRRELDPRSLGPLNRLLLWGLAGRRSGATEADWVSYLLFDGGLARRLIAAGRRDALARASAIRASLAH